LRKRSYCKKSRNVLNVSLRKTQKSKSDWSENKNEQNFYLIKRN
jgi:hypothetical protein